MQPSAKWQTITPFISATTGINERTGAADFSDVDFTNYPPFTVPEYTSAPEQKSDMFWWITNDDFPLNTAIDDWSIAYTAVDNPDISLNNIGVFMSNPDTPAFYTDNRNYAPIAFYTSLGYKVIYDNISGTPHLTDAYRFKNPPYTNSRYVWSPNAGGATYQGDLATFYRDANCEGYAAMFATFGIKSLFLEIRVRPVNISGDPLVLQDYSLKEYAAFTEQQRSDNPISMAYCMVHRRAATNGTYSQVNSFYTDINLVMGRPLKGYSSDIYTYFNNVHEPANVETMYLPLWGIPYKGRSGNYIRYCDGNYADPNGQNTSDFFYGYDKVDGTQVINTGGGEYRYTKYMLGTDLNIEYLRRCAAAYGLFFCDDLYTSENKSLESSEYEADGARWIRPEMHLGIIEEDGYTRGNYTSGEDNADQPQFNWTDSTDSTYDPHVTPIPTENEYSRQTNWNLVGDLTTLTKRYVLNSAAVQHLGRELWTISSDLIDDGQGGVDYNNLNDKMLDSFLTQNPIDCIVDLRRYPMEIPKADSCLLKLGKYETIVGGYTMEKTVYNYLFELRQPIYPLFGDSFIDYEPYTHFELYIPFCGTVSIEPADILGRKLAVQLVVDFTTGTATAYVMSDNLVIKSAQGQIAIDIPVSGIQSVTAASQISNAIIDARVAKAGEIGAVGNLASVSGITKMLTNPFQTGAQISQAQWQQDRADYNLTHQNIPPHTIGAASSAASWAIDLNCRLIIYYPTGEVIRDANPPEFILQKLAEYGHTTGFACCLTGQLKEFLGLTVGINADLNGIRTNSGVRPATLQELQLLEAALEEGVIL